MNRETLENKVNEYINANWSSDDSLDDLTIFLDQGYLQLVVARLVSAGAIDPENSYDPKTERLCLKYIEGYTFENEAADIEECLSSVNPEIFVNPKTNETKFIADYQCIDTEINK